MNKKNLLFIGFLLAGLLSGFVSGYYFAYEMKHRQVRNAIVIPGLEVRESNGTYIVRGKIRVVMGNEVIIFDLGDLYNSTSASDVINWSIKFKKFSNMHFMHGVYNITETIHLLKNTKLTGDEYHNKEE